MEIYCKNTSLLEKAVKYSRRLGIDHFNAEIDIKRLPPSFGGKYGIIEHPRVLGKRVYINIYIKLNKERYITLAHEMVHQWQWEVLSPQRHEKGKPAIMSHGPSFYAWRKPLNEYLIPLTRMY